MTHPVLRDISFFAEKMLPALGQPDLVIQGPVQEQSPRARHDILVLYPQIPQSTTFRFSTERPDGRGNTYDLVFHDRETLAYAIEDARETGLGEIIHLGATGNILFDPKNDAHDLQQKLTDIYQRGPLPLHIQDIHKGAAALVENIRQIPETAYFEAPLAAICSQIARFALRLDFHWAGKGAEAGRLLEQHQPDFLFNLKLAFQQAVFSHRPQVMMKFLENHMAPLVNQNLRGEDLETASEQPPLRTVPAPVDLEDAFESARCNPDNLATYLTGRNLLAKQAATTIACQRVEKAMEQISLHLYQHNPLPYFLTLGHVISVLAEANAALHTNGPSLFSMTEKIDQLCRRYPPFKQAFSFALCGVTSKFFLLSKTILDTVGKDYLPYYEWKSPAVHRLNPAVYGISA